MLKKLSFYSLFLFFCIVINSFSQDEDVIIKAAKAAGAASVRFPDGTVVMIAPEPALVVSGAASSNPWDAELAGHDAH